MKSENPYVSHENVENELDVRGLCRALWRGKGWILSCALLFAAAALAYSYAARQQWSANAITDKPTVSMLGGYYSQQQFLRNLDAQAFSMSQPDRPSIADDAYQAFIVQLAAYDTRRDFWLQTDYYKQRREGDARADAALLDELVDAIRFTPRDESRKTNDSVKLAAETAADANTLLRQYVDFASRRAAGHLNEEIRGAWAGRTVFMQSQIKRREAVARAVYEREVRSVELALKVARQQGIERSQTDVPPDELPDAEMFLLGRPLLQGRLEVLQAVGPGYDREYDRDRAMLATLNVGPVLEETFQTYRYLRTPEEPVRRDSPRRVFLLAMWGITGVLVGAVAALLRRSH